MPGGAAPGPRREAETWLRPNLAYEPDWVQELRDPRAAATVSCLRVLAPFASMLAIETDGELVVDRERRTSGTRRDAEYLDATASLWYCNIGYGRDEIADAAQALRRLPRTRRSATSRTARRSSSPNACGRSRRSRSPRSSSRAAARTRSTPRRRWRGATGSSSARPSGPLITREHAYAHIAGTSLAGIERTPPATAARGRRRELEWDSPTALRDAIAAAGPNVSPRSSASR